MQTAIVVVILILGLVGGIAPGQSQEPQPRAASSRIDPAVQKEIDRLSAADKIEKGRGFTGLAGHGAPRRRRQFQTSSVC